MNVFSLPHPDRRLVVGIGSALVDIVVPADDAFVRRTGVPKGGMVYFDSSSIDAFLEDSGADPTVVPGGAACNTMVGIGRLGGQSRFIGKRGDDPFGRLFEDGLALSGVEPFLVRTRTPTGRVLSLISPDSQRTMLTCLGAASEMRPEEVDTRAFAEAAVTLVEGYLVYNPELFGHAIQSARDAGSLVALDLASFTVVEECMDRFQDVVNESVDILIANEDEAFAFTRCRDEEKALASLGECARLAVLKLGARGSRVSCEGRVIDIAAASGGGVVDTTGAGDLWASGFLFGLVRQLPLEICGRLASVCGHEVCKVKGAAIPEDGWSRIARLVDDFAAADAPGIGRSAAAGLAP